MSKYFNADQEAVIVKHAKSVAKHADALKGAKARFKDAIAPVMVEAFEAAGLPAWGDAEWELVDTIPKGRRTTIQAIKDEAMAVFCNTDEKAAPAIRLVLNLAEDTVLTGEHWDAYRTETKSKYRVGVKTVENYLSTVCTSAGYAMKKPAPKKEKWEALVAYLGEKEFDASDIAAALKVFCTQNDMELPASLCQVMEQEAVVAYAERVVDAVGV